MNIWIARYSYRYIRFISLFPIFIQYSFMKNLKIQMIVLDGIFSKLKVFIIFFLSRFPPYGVIYFFVFCFLFNNHRLLYDSFFISHTVNVFILVFEHVLSPLNYSITLQCRKQLRPIQPEIIKRRLIHDLYERSSLPTTTQQYGLARSRWALAITLFYHYVRSFLPTTRQQWTGQIKVSFGDHWVLWPCAILPPQNKTAVWALSS